MDAGVLDPDPSAFFPHPAFSSRPHRESRAEPPGLAEPPWLPFHLSCSLPRTSAGVRLGLGGGDLSPQRGGMGQPSLALTGCALSLNLLKSQAFFKITLLSPLCFPKSSEAHRCFCPSLQSEMFRGQPLETGSSDCW